MPRFNNPLVGFSSSWHQKWENPELDMAALYFPSLPPPHYTRTVIITPETSHPRKETELSKNSSHGPSAFPILKSQAITEFFRAQSGRIWLSNEVRLLNVYYIPWWKKLKCACIYKVIWRATCNSQIQYLIYCIYIFLTGKIFFFLFFKYTAAEVGSVSSLSVN